MPEPDKTRIHAFETPADLWKWLETHHDSEPELWLKIFKKGSGLATVTWEDAVIEALCWGWIDGVKKSFDDQAYLQRFTPRRKRSNWSRRNREHVERLAESNRMQEVGMVHVRAAQADGRWESAYAPVSEMTVPDDFLEALQHRPEAKAFFETLTRSDLYSIYLGLQTAKKPETRQKRFDRFLTLLEKGEKKFR